jgi:UPF0716 family protein affecting phage T7 exclusion
MSSLAFEVGGIPLGVVWTWVLMAFAAGFGLGLLIKGALASVRWVRRRGRQASPQPAPSIGPGRRPGHT